MRRTLRLALLALALPTAAPAQVSLVWIGQSYAENFDGLGRPGSSTPFAGVLPGVLSDRYEYSADQGVNPMAGLYSYGLDVEADRALGSIASFGDTYYYGIVFQNNTGQTIYGLSIAYTGEQWHLGGAGRPESITVGYQITATNPTNLTTGTYTSIPELTFTSPVYLGFSNSLYGNYPGHRSTLGANLNLSATPIASGQYFTVRFADFGDRNANHGLAVDDFVLTLNNSLPVELAAFSASASGPDALLRWTTASETNNAGFHVETLRGTAWTDLGFVAGRGTTAERSDYAFTATGLTAGTHAFRLRQVDTDGAVHLSGVTQAEIGVEGGSRVTLLGQRAVRVETNEAEAVSVRVFDVLGRVVASERREVSGTAEFALPPGLASGSYVVRVEGARFAETRRLVVG